jgi:hypothetical protein
MAKKKKKKGKFQTPKMTAGIPQDFDNWLEPIPEYQMREMFRLN